MVFNPNALRTLRLNRRLRQRQLANLLGVRVGAVNAWERSYGLPPDDATIARLADVLGVTPAALTWGVA